MWLTVKNKTAYINLKVFTYFKVVSLILLYEEITLICTPIIKYSNRKSTSNAHTTI